MLKRLVETLRCPVCRSVDGAWRVDLFSADTNGHIRDGVLVCSDCNAWYPVEDALLDFGRGTLLDEAAMLAFCQRFTRELGAAGLRRPGRDAPEEAQVPQLLQRQHFDSYAAGEAHRYNNYQRMPFWKAVDYLTFERWRKLTRQGGLVLDIGCADGRSAFQLLDGANTVVGFDVSKAMIRKAMRRAREIGVEERTSFFVADGTAMPFKPGTFDTACTYGVLHHLDRPDVACAEICAILKPGGLYLGSENNASVFRALFEMTMRLFPIWTELAGREPLIAAAMLRAWTKGLPMSLDSRTMVFLPPHMCNLLGYRGARLALRAVDAVCARLPWLRSNGGLIVFEGRKQ